MKMSDGMKDSIMQACLSLLEEKGKKDCKVEVIARAFKESKGKAILPWNLRWTALSEKIAEEKNIKDNFFYCFVHTEKNDRDKPLGSYLVSSNIVVKSMKERYAYWKEKKPNVKELGRGFGLGTKRDYKYPVKTPLAEDCKVDLKFKR